MNGFFSRLSEALQRGPVALATVTSTRGSTPRLAGARQFRAEDGETIGTVGGGATEARVLELAGKTLVDGCARTFESDLRGRPGDIREGVCGGTMQVGVVRLEPERDADIVRAVETSLRAGRRISLSTCTANERPLALEQIGAAFTETLVPPPRLLIVGSGHIGRCLAHLASGLDFSVAVQDDRPEWLEETAFPPGCSLDLALDPVIAALRTWEGPRFAALVTRGFSQDVQALEALAALPALDYVGLLGSRTRIATVLAAQRDAGVAQFPETIFHAPVGVEIGAETPEEIAVSIAAEMIRVRRGPGRAR